MNALFSLLLQMSLEGGIAILLVFAARLLLRKAPRRLLALLWVVPLVLLLVPLRPQSSLSVQPARSSAFAVSFDQNNANSQPAAPLDAANPPKQGENAANLSEIAAKQNHPAAAVGVFIWILGMVVLLWTSGVSLWKILRAVRVSMPVAKGVFLADGLPSPFIWGLFRPKIFLPSAIAGEERRLILQHERAHIRRGDHWTRVFALEGGGGLVENMTCPNPSYRQVSLGETEKMFPESAQKALESDENAALFQVFTAEGIDTGGRLFIVDGALWAGRISRETGMYAYVFQVRQTAP